MWRVSWWTRWRVYEYVRNSLWIVPLICVGIAIGLGFLLPITDAHTRTRIGIVFSAGAASSVLGAIAGGMITFTGFVFSILLLAVQFGSSQFSPRLLRRFLRDPTTKIAFGTFIATFVYALMVLRVVGSGKVTFVPSNSVSVSLYFLLISMLMFLRLVSRTTQGLRVATVLRELGRDGRRSLNEAYPLPVTGPEKDDPPPLLSGPVRIVTHRFESGILQSLGIGDILDYAQKTGTVIELVPRVGDLVITGAPIFHVYGGDADVDHTRLQRMIAVGDERTMKQDPAFVFRLLADISSKALSPGVNDPTTSIQALDQIDILLRDVASRQLNIGIVHDARGDIRFIRRVPSWEDFLSLALVETHQFGVGSVQVMRRMRALLDDLREVVPECRRPAVDDELRMVESAAMRSFPDLDDQQAAAKADRQGLGSTEDTSPRSGKH